MFTKERIERDLLTWWLSSDSNKRRALPNCDEKLWMKLKLTDFAEWKETTMGLIAFDILWMRNWVFKW